MASPAPIRVLLIDDDPVTAAVVRTYLQAQDADYELTVVASYDQGLIEATAGGHDAIVIDDCLDHHSGAQLVASLQQHGCRQPVIVLTNRRDRAFEQLVRGMGATEVLTRSELSAGALGRTLRYALERRQDQQTLQAWSRSAQQLAHAQRAPAALVDPRGVLVEANPALCELLGLGYGRIVGRPLRDFLRERHGELPDGPWDDSLHGAEDVQPVRCSTLRLPDGSRLLTIEPGIDTTRIFRRLSADPDEASLLRNLIAHLPDQIYLKDRDSRFVLNNPCHLRVLGAPDQAAALGRTDLDFFPPEQAEAFLADDRLVIDGGQAILDQIERVRYADGIDRWVSVSKAPLHDEHGRVIGLVGMSRDISDRMDDAQTVLEQQRRIAALVNAAPVILYSFDASGTYTLSEGAGLAGLGLRPGQVVGHNVFDYTDGTPLAHDACRRAVAGERVAVDEMQFGERWFSVRMEPIRDELGQVREVIGVAHDITDELHMRAELRLRDSEFLQAQKMEAVGRLAGGVAHDFNNVLTAIMGQAELLHARLDHDPRAEAAQRIVSVARKGAAMIRRLLAFCRRQAVEPQPLDLGEVVRATAELAAPLLGEGIDLHLALPVERIVVLADEIQLEQVLLNLLVNARDAMDGGGRITIATSLERLDGIDEALLTVTDTGRGMDAATLARCREPFFTTKQEDKGTGLGLATVDDIVRQLGGRTEIVSAPGQGCTVFIALPALPAASAKRDSDSGFGLAPLDRRGRVLVAEDQDDVRSMLGQVLEGLGCNATLCANGAEAWERLRADAAAYDLLISDLRMPVMDGLALAERVIAAAPELPILFISGHVDEPEELPHGPGYRLLPKPFSRSRLIQQIAELLDR